MIRSLERRWKGALAAALRIVFRSKPLPVPPSLSRILIVRQHNQLGDMLCVVPLLRALKQKYPGCALSLVTSPVNNEIMRNNRYLDEIIDFDKREFLQGGTFHPLRLARFIRELRKRSFEAVIVPSTVSTSLTSDLLGYLSGAPLRIGAGTIDGRKNPTAFFFTHPVTLDWRHDPHRHQAIRNLDIGARLGLNAEDLSPEITLLKEEEEEGRNEVRKVRGECLRAIAVHPGAGKTPNRWPAERFAQVVETLAQEFGAKIFVTSGPMDTEPIQTLLSTLSTTVQLVHNQPVRRVASLLKEMDLLISNDTGIMHVGGGVHIPVLALFGPTDPGQWAPIGPRNRYIVGKGGKIDAIRVEEVLDAARQMLRSDRD